MGNCEAQAKQSKANQEEVNNVSDVGSVIVTTTKPKRVLERLTK